MTRRERSRATGLWPCLALACAALLLPPSAVAKSVPGVVVNVTITGQTTGHQSVSYPGAPADPDTGCPAIAPSGYQSSATVHWSATYTGVLLALKKATGALSSRRPPKASGGATGGSYALNGTTYVLNGGQCWTPEPFSFNSTLGEAPGAGGRPGLQRDVGADLFLLTGGIAGSPPAFTLPNGPSGNPDPISQLLPFYAPPDAYVFGTQSSKKVGAGFAEVAMEWNKLEPQLQALRHRKSIRFAAHGSYAKTFSFTSNAADGNSLVTDCDQAADTYRGADGTTCNAATSADYQVTVRRVKLVTIFVG